MNHLKNWDELDGVEISKFPTIFEDNRGEYDELFNLRSDPNYKFKQLSFVHNKKNIIRGMHGDWGTTKKVTVVSGIVIQVLLDCRLESKTYGQFKSSFLSGDDKLLITLPPGVANGIQVLDEEAVYIYLQDTFYKDHKQFTITPFDKHISKAFILDRKPIISERDLDMSKTFSNLNHKK